MIKDIIKNIFKDSDFSDLIVVRTIKDIFKDINIGFKYYKSNIDNNIFKLYYYTEDNNDIYPFFLYEDKNNFKEVIDSKEHDNIYNINKDIYYNNIIKKKEHFKLNNKYKIFRDNLRVDIIDYDYIPKEHLKYLL